MSKQKIQKARYYSLYCATDDDFPFTRPTLALVREKLKEMLERFPGGRVDYHR
jgi:hypothetical protein